MSSSPAPWWSRPAGKRLRRTALGALAALLLLALAAMLPAWAEQVNGRGSNFFGNTTSATCLLPAPGVHDVAVVGISSTTAVSAVSDSSSNTYTSQVSAGASTSTNVEGARAYLYTAPLASVPAGTLTITVTLAAGSYGGVGCYDVVGFGGTAAHTSTGTGTASGNGTTTQSGSVTSYTPGAGNFEISVFAGSMCNGLGSVTFPSVPAEPAGGKIKPNNAVFADSSSGTQCSYAGTSPSTAAYNWWPVAYDAYVLQAAGTAVTDPYALTFNKPIEGCHAAAGTCPGSLTVINPVGDWAEVAMDLPKLTVLTQAISETLNFAVVAGSATATPSDTITGLTAAEGGAQATPSDQVNGLSLSQSLANVQNDGFSMCVKVSYLGVNVSNSCLAQSYTISLIVNNAHPLVGQSVTFTMTANPYVFGPYFIRLFDISNSTSTFLVSCVGTSCVLPMASHHSGTQLFQAGVTNAGLTHASLANSTIVAVTWGGGGGGNLCVFYVLIGGGNYNPPVLTYYSNGALTTYTMTLAKTCVVQDSGTPWSVAPNPTLTGVSASSLERAFSQNTTWASTGGGTFHWTFQHQFNVAVSYKFTQAESNTNSPTFFYVQFGASLNAPNTKTVTTYWLDAGSVWRATNPFTTSPDLTVWFASPAGGVITSANPIVVVYGPKNACTGPWQAQLQAGCFWAGMGPYITIFGLQGFMGLVMLGVDGSIWIQTKNGWIVVIVMAAAAVAFAGALPSYFFLFALVLSGISVAGVLYRLGWRRT